MKQILITGANGQLGNCIRDYEQLYPEWKFLYTDITELDLCNSAAINKFFESHEIHYIVNCAAFTAVDKAEEEPELCLKINKDAVSELGHAAMEHGAKIIHISTDYVFDGNNCRPYVETDETNPISVYGMTKLEGEKALLSVCPQAIILRTAWLYSEYGRNFVKTMRSSVHLLTPAIWQKQFFLSYKDPKKENGTTEFIISPTKVYAVGTILL